MLRIIVSGMIASDPFQGGATWAVLQYLLGFRQLGHQVYFIEPVQLSRLTPTGCPLGLSTTAAYFREVAVDFGLDHSAALLDEESQETTGLSYRQLVEIAASSDILINISGMLQDQELLERIPIRAYLDLDPAFIQLWHHVQKVDMRFAGHTHFVTIGQNIGTPKCDIPTCGLTWIKTLQPVILDFWPVMNDSTPPAFTTIGNWRGYGSIDHAGKFYGQKAHSWRNLFPLPGRTSAAFMPALAIHPDETKDLAALEANGWKIQPPELVARTPQTYQQFVQQSWAELGIAKSGYVVSHCGWFSDRSACYLASGRPVLAQETGFSDFLPSTEGIIAFSDVDGARLGAESLLANYAVHARAARAIAEEFFDSNRVLPQLLSKLVAT